MFKVEVHGIKNATEKERKAFLEAIEDLEQAVNSPEFWDKLYLKWDKISHKGPYDSFYAFRRMFLSGQDDFNKVKDSDLDFYVTLYYSFFNTVGYTRPTTWFTWFNRKFFKRLDNSELGGHISHEYLHNLGLDHPNGDRNSLVYQFGFLVRDVIRGWDKDAIKQPMPYRMPWYKKLLPWNWF